MLRRLIELSDPAVGVVQACAVGYGDLPHRLLAKVCGLSTVHMDEACAELVAARVLEVDPTGMGYRFRHTLLQEAVRESLLPASRVHWHERWADELEADLAAGSKEFRSIAAARHRWETGDAPRAFTATLRAADTARSMHASAELTTLLNRLLDLWPDVPDAEGQAGNRDLVLDEAIDAAVGSDDWVAGLNLIDHELDAAPVGDVVRRTILRVRPEWFLDLLGRDNDTAGDGPTGTRDTKRMLATLDTLLDAPPSPLLVEALIRLGYDLVVTAPEDSARAHHRAVEVSDAVGQPRKQLWARCQLANHLALTGRVDEAVTMLNDQLVMAGDSVPIEASVLEAESAWWLCSLGRYREAIDVGLHAQHLIGASEHARRTWALATAHVVTSLLNVGRWADAETQLAEVTMTGVAGPRGAVLDVLTGVLACYRGKPQDGLEALGAAQARLPSGAWQSWPPIRAWLGWLDAEVALGRDDVQELRRNLIPLWNLTGLEIASDIAWRPMLVAARFEADLASRTFGRRGGRTPATTSTETGAEHMAALATAAQRLHRNGHVGAAWATQLDAEQARFGGDSEPSAWTAVAERWHDLQQPHEQGWALLRTAEAHVGRGESGQQRSPCGRRAT